MLIYGGGKSGRIHRNQQPSDRRKSAPAPARKRPPIQVVADGMLFPSSQQAADALGISRSTLQKNLKRRGRFERDGHVVEVVANDILRQR